MPRKVKAPESSSSSVISSADDSSTSSSADEAAIPSGAYSEGKAKAISADASSGKTIAPLCPTPLNIVIGVFSALTAVAGTAMIIVGGNALNSPGDPQAGLHRALLGTGGALLALGACGGLSMFVQREQDLPAATNA